MPSTFDSSFGSTTEPKEINHETYLYESITTLNAGSYADKYTLYPWSYVLEESSNRLINENRLDVTAHTMLGLSQDYCGYFESMSEQVFVEPETHMSTMVELSEHPCGHYVVFSLDTDDSSTTFRHLTTFAKITGVFDIVLIMSLWLLSN